MIQRMAVTVDTKKTNYKNVGKINHGDDLILEVEVVSDGSVISFDDPMVDLLVKKSDGKMIRQTSGIELIKPNIFVIELSKDCVTSPGLTTNQLIINDNGRISTCMFYFTINNSLEKDVIQSIAKVEVLEQLDEYAIHVQDRMNRISDDLVQLEIDFEATSAVLIEAEVDRNEKEQVRVEAEIVRIQNEDNRIEAEQIRVDADTIRDQRESERILNEEERNQNESERFINENQRQKKENDRQVSEINRQANEINRDSNESQRKVQENKRVNSENERVAAETIRRNNENERQKTLTEIKKKVDNMYTKEEVEALIAEAIRNLK